MTPRRAFPGLARARRRLSSGSCPHNLRRPSEPAKRASPRAKGIRPMSDRPPQKPLQFPHTHIITQLHLVSTKRTVIVMESTSTNGQDHGGLARATLTVEEAARVLGISRAAAYQSARSYVDSSGQRGLPVIQIGRRLLVPRERLHALLAGQIRSL